MNTFCCELKSSEFDRAYMKVSGLHDLKYTDHTKRI